MALVSSVTKETTCVEESIAGSGTRAEPLETIAENKKEQKSAAKRRQRLLKAAQQPPS